AVHAGVQILPELWPVVAGVSAWIVAEGDGEREVLDVTERRTKGPQRWLELDSDLSRFAGRTVRLTFHVSVQGLPEGRAAEPVVAWAPVRITSARKAAGSERGERPNVLFIV